MLYPILHLIFIFKHCSKFPKNNLFNAIKICLTRKEGRRFP